MVLKIISLTKYYVAGAKPCFFDCLVTDVYGHHDCMIAALKQKYWQTVAYFVVVYVC